MKNTINPNPQNIANDVLSYFNSSSVTYITNASARIKQTLEVIETEKLFLILNTNLFSKTGNNYFLNQTPNIYPNAVCATVANFNCSVQDVSTANKVTTSTITSKFTAQMGININDFISFITKACIYNSIQPLTNLLLNNCTNNINDESAIKEYFQNIF